jgi:hypothetical protein
MNTQSDEAEAADRCGGDVFDECVSEGRGFWRGREGRRRRIHVGSHKKKVRENRDGAGAGGGEKQRLSVCFFFFSLRSFFGLLSRGNGGGMRM